MTSDELLDLLNEAGAVKKGHFLLSSGRHSDVYFEKFRALEQPEVARQLGEAIADKFRSTAVDVVLSPAVGGIIIGLATALALRARFVFAEREDGQLKLRRGFEIAPGERVLVVDDVVTTGKSLGEVVDLVRADDLAGVACILDRSNGAATGRLQALSSVEAVSWAREDCPLCAAGLPVDDPGSRRLSTENRL